MKITDVTVNLVAVHRDGAGQLLLGRHGVAGAPVQRAETAVAVGDKRTKSEVGSVSV